MKTKGIHHVTAITSDVKKNLFFYQGLLGLRLVKLTVNFDDPTSYHLYYGDGRGTPGSVLTFFVYPDAGKGIRGNSQITRIYFAIPKNSKVFWKNRLLEYNVKVEDNGSLDFQDHEGLGISLVPGDSKEYYHWKESHIKPDKSIRKIAGIGVSTDTTSTTELLNIIGFSGKDELKSSGSFIRIESDTKKGMLGAGSVHHAAFKSDAGQEKYRQLLSKKGYSATNIIDRYYFRSIYFRDNADILFEIATEKPGFLVDEDEEDLGSQLRLPPWLEPLRNEIRKSLPNIT